MRADPLLILCGGLSSRMGSPKPLLPFQGQTLISRQVSHSLPNRPVWLAASGLHYDGTDGAVYLPDALPDRQGALSAIAPALTLAAEQGYDGLYVVSCDTLLLSEPLITLLQTAADTPEWHNGITLFRHENQLMPLLARWSSRLSDGLNAHVAEGGRRVQQWVKQQPYQTVALPDAWAALSNFNTPEEFAAARQAASDGI